MNQITRSRPPGLEFRIQNLKIQGSPTGNLQAKNSLQSFITEILKPFTAPKRLHWVPTFKFHLLILFSSFSYQLSETENNLPNLISTVLTTSHCSATLREGHLHSSSLHYFSLAQLRFFCFSSICSKIYGKKSSQRVSSFIPDSFA